MRAVDPRSSRCYTLLKRFCQPPSRPRADASWSRATLIVGGCIMRSRARRLFVALVVVAITMAGTTAHAQYRASLQGTVTDSQGGVIPGATVTLVDKETNRTLTAITDANGLYVFNGLAPRPYT